MTARRSVPLSMTDCRIIRAALAVFWRDKKARFKVNATSTRMNYLNRILAEAWPGQGVAHSEDYIAQEGQGDE